MLENIELDGNVRTELGGAYAKRLLKAKRIPAVIYATDPSENIYIDIDFNQVTKEYLKGNLLQRICEIKIGKKVLKVIPYQIDIHPVSDKVRHIDFMSIEGKKEIKVMIPCTFANTDKSLGLKRGGYLNKIARKVQLFCDPKNIPAEIIVDCGNLRIKEKIQLSQITLPAGTRATTKKDLIIVNILGRGGKQEAEETPVTAAAPTAAAKK